MRFLIAAAVCCGATATLEITRATRRTRLPATTAHAREARVAPPPPPPPPSPWPADAESLVMERRRPKHWKACALTVAVVSLARVAAFGCPCALASAARRFLDVDCENRRARVVAFLIAAVAYVLEAARSSSLRYVRDVRSAEEVDGFLRDALDAAPAVSCGARIKLRRVTVGCGSRRRRGCNMEILCGIIDAGRVGGVVVSLRAATLRRPRRVVEARRHERSPR